MNVKSHATSPTDWNKVLRVTFRIVSAFAVLGFKLAVIVVSMVVGIFFGGNKNEESENNCVDEDDVKYKFGAESKYEVYKNHTRF